MRHRHFAHMQAKKRRNRYKHAAIISGVLLVGFSLLVGAAYYNQAGLSSGKMDFPAFADTPRDEKPRYTAQPDWPDHTPVAAVGTTDAGTIAVHGDESQRPIASIAKVITALALLEKYPIEPGEDGPTFTLTEADETIYQNYVAQNGSVTHVEAGMEITLHQAISAMMLPSANNIADSTVIWAFGSLEKYHTYANKMLKRLDLDNTVVGGDASGLSPKTQSTPRDLLALAYHALQNQTLADIAAQHEFNYPVTGMIENYNRLVTENGFTGLKPGLSDEANGTLLFSTKHTIDGEETDLIGVVLGVDGPQTPYLAALQLTESTKATLKKRAE